MRTFPNIVHYKFTVKDLLAAELLILVALDLIGDFVPEVKTLRYVLDVFNVLLLINALPLIGKRTKGVPLFVVALTLLTLYSLAATVINGVSPILFIWEALSFFRLYIFIILAIVYWDWRYAKKILSVLLKLQPINLAFVLIQFGVFGLIQDNIGGIFGTTVGCNGPLNAYLCIVALYALNGYICRPREIEAKWLAITVISSLAVAAVAELKFFYVEFCVISILAILLNRPSLKTIAVIMMAFASLWVGLAILQNLSPGHYAILTNMDLFFAEADNSNLATGYGISRLNVYSQVSTLVFPAHGIQELLGLGLGSAAYSTFSIFCSPIYSAFGFLHYEYLQTAIVFIQLGYLGTALYAFAILSVPLSALHLPRRNRAHAAWIIPFGISASAVLLMNCVYNNVIHEAYAILWAIPMALTLIYVRDTAIHKAKIMTCGQGGESD